MEEAKCDEMGMKKNVTFNSQMVFQTTKYIVEDIDEIKKQLALLTKTRRGLLRRKLN